MVGVGGRDAIEGKKVPCREYIVKITRVVWGSIELNNFPITQVWT